MSNSAKNTMTDEEKNTAAPEETEEHRKQVVIPLLQHRGAACEPLVEVGDTVLRGQKIGEEDEYGLAVSIHSSVSGRVIAIEERLHPHCSKQPSIIIESDGASESIKFKTNKNPSKAQILDSLEDAGIIELNGYPVYNTLLTEKTIDTVILNLTNPGDVSSNCTGENISKIISGVKLLMTASGASQAAIVANKNNKQIASSIQSRLGASTKLVTVKRNYMPSMSNLLAYDMTGIRISNTGTPADAGVIVSSAHSALAVSRAVLEGIPLIDVNLTVSGVVSELCVKTVAIGTSFQDVVQSCGGYVGEPGKIIMNGVLSGTAQVTDEVPVIKTVTEITVQPPHEVLREKTGSCVHCARCVDVCPVNILPGRIAAFADVGKYDECEKLHVQSCVECGMCSYVCPSGRYNLQLIRFAKTALLQGFKIPEEKQYPTIKLGCQSCNHPCHMWAPLDGIPLKGSDKE